MRFSVRSLVLAGIATLALVVVGILVLGGGDDDSEVAGPAPFRTTPLVQLDSDRVTVARAPLCEGIDERQVSAALGGAPESTRSWTNGDPVPVGEGVEDVGHEFGCEYVGADGTLARAWVFAPPVTRGQAHALARKAARTPDCAAGDGPAFGHPTLALTCPVADGGMRASSTTVSGGSPAIPSSSAGPSPTAAVTSIPIVSSNRTRLLRKMVLSSASATLTGFSLQSLFRYGDHC